MLKLTLATLAAFLILGGAASAQTCSPYSYTLANGQTADADQVMANFNNIRNCAITNLAPINSPTLNGNIMLNGTTYFTWSGTTYANIGPYGIWANYISLGPLSGGSGGNLAADGSNVFIRANSWMVFQNTNLGTTAEINNTGGMWAWSYNNFSDARLKTNVQPLTGALDLVDRLRAVRYQFRGPADRTVGKTLALPADPQIGLLAQEVKGVVPEAVTSDKDGVYGINQAQLIPVLVQAIKELHGEVEDLKAQLAAVSKK